MDVYAGFSTARRLEQGSCRLGGGDPRQTQRTGIPCRARQLDNIVAVDLLESVTRTDCRQGAAENRSGRWHVRYGLVRYSV